MNNLYAQLFVYDDYVCECTESLEYSVQCTESQQRDGFLRSVIGCVGLTPNAVVVWSIRERDRSRRKHMMRLCRRRPPQSLSSR